MTFYQPVWQQPTTGDPDLTYSGFLMRNHNRSLMAAGDGVQGVEGVLSAGSGLKVSAGTGFAVNVASGRAMVNDDYATNGGQSMCWMDSSGSVTCPSAPGSGSDLHRIVLRVRDKLEHTGAGGDSTYDFLPDIIPDTTHTGTLPATQPSCITLASVLIPAGSGSITAGGVVITDMREMCIPNAVQKSADTSRSSTTSMSVDPALQLTNLQSNCTMWFQGQVFYIGGTGSSEGDLKFTWNCTGCTMLYNVAYRDTGGNLVLPPYHPDTDTITAQTAGTSTGQLSLLFEGIITTTGAPCSANFKWAQGSSNSQATTVQAGSWLQARRLV